MDRKARQRLAAYQFLKLVHINFTFSDNVRIIYVSSFKKNEEAQLKLHLFDIFILYLNKS
jgi:hypothetical protein